MLTAEQSAALQADLRAAFEGQPGITVQPAASDNKPQ
jgi:hypothetical protein